MNLIKAIGVGALGLLAIGGWTYWTNFSNKRSPPTKQQTLQILESVRQEFYPILIKIAAFVETELAPKGLPPSQNQKIIMLDPQIRSQISKINDKIYSKYSEEEVMEATETLYKQDGDVKHQKKQFKEEYIKSLMGVVPDRQMIISRKLNKKQILKAVQEILQDKIVRLEVQMSGKIDPQELLSFLQLDVEEDQRVTKEVIKSKLGLCSKDSIKVFQFVVVQYKKDINFEGSYQKILTNYNNKIAKLISA